MGVNGQKRKNKQGPVPSLEESLPKKFKSDKTAKAKKPEYGLKVKTTTTPNSTAAKPAPKAPTNSTRIAEVVDLNAEDEQSFVTVKASLFDSEDDEDDQAGLDEFERLEEDVDRYPQLRISNFSDNEEEEGHDSDSVDDSEEEEADEKMFSDSSDEEDLTAANMEALSAKLDTFAREDILAAQDELLNPAQPVAEGVLLSTSNNEDLSSVKTRIMEIVRVLGDFKNLREEGVRRKEYIERLVHDIAGYYSYNSYLARKFLEMFSVAEVYPLDLFSECRLTF
jgi:ribosomal RNA methyltransferase Nop2